MDSNCKLLFSFIVTALTFLDSDLSFGQKTVIDNPYLNLKYDSVVIYDFESRSKTSDFIPIIDSKGKLAGTVKKSVKLDAKLASEFSRIIGEKSSYGQGTSMCFLPHLGVVYYKGGKPVSDVNICLLCNRLQSNHRIPAQEQGPQKGENGVYFIQDGMSKGFRKYINSLLKKYRFSHQITHPSPAD